MLCISEITLIWMARANSLTESVREVCCRICFCLSLCSNLSSQLHSLTLSPSLLPFMFVCLSVSLPHHHPPCPPPPPPHSPSHFSSFSCYLFIHSCLYYFSLLLVLFGLREQLALLKTQLLHNRQWKCNLFTLTSTNVGDRQEANFCFCMYRWLLLVYWLARNLTADWLFWNDLLFQKTCLGKYICKFPV